MLEQVRDGQMSPDDAMQVLKRAPFEDLGYAKIDSHRALRTGTQEVIFGLHKTKEQIAGIAARMLEDGCQDILMTRLCPEAADYVREQLGAQTAFQYEPVAQLGIANPNPSRKQVGSIVVASAGTSDMPVCEEAAITAEVLGNRVERLYDVGVAGLHRLLAHTEELQRARVVIAVAGMEGALASVIGGLVSCPVIAVPTSVGYGAHFGGLTPLLAMLNSCAGGVTVVNIDNGFGAAYAASRINQMKGIEE